MGKRKSTDTPLRRPKRTKPDFPAIYKPTLLPTQAIMEIPIEFLLGQYHRLATYCDVISLTFLSNECDKLKAALESKACYPADVLCFFFQLVACILQQSSYEDFSSIAYQRAADLIDTDPISLTSPYTFLRRVYHCFWLRCEGELDQCRQALSIATQKAKAWLNDQQDSNQHIQIKKIQSSLIMWDLEIAILLSKPNIVGESDFSVTTKDSIDAPGYLYHFAYKQDVLISRIITWANSKQSDNSSFIYHYGQVAKFTSLLNPIIQQQAKGQIGSFADATSLDCISLLHNLQALTEILEREKLRMYFFTEHISVATRILQRSIRGTHDSKLSACAQRAILCSVDMLSKKSLTQPMAMIIKAALYDKNQLSQQSAPASTELGYPELPTLRTMVYFRFNYLIKARSRPGDESKGSAYICQDGTVICEPKVCSYFRKVFAKGPFKALPGELQECRYGDLTVYLVLAKPKKTAKLISQGNKRLSAIADFEDDSEKNVRVSLWNDATTKDLGFAIKIGPSRWYIDIFDDFLGHVVVFKGEKEEVISAPITYVEVPAYANALLYTYVQDKGKQSGMAFVYDQVYCSKDTSGGLRNILSKNKGVLESSAVTTRYSAWTIKPSTVPICTGYFEKDNQFSLTATFSRDITNDNIIVMAYETADCKRQRDVIPISKAREGRQYRIVIDSIKYQNAVIVFNLENEYIVSRPVARWTQGDERKLADLKLDNVDNNQILKSFPSTLQQFVLEDLKWFENKVLKKEARERRSIVKGRIEKGEKICWRTDRHSLGPAFYGMQYKSFERIWKSVSKEIKENEKNEENEENEGGDNYCFI